MIEQIYKCDVCGVTRGPANHWLKMFKATSVLHGPQFIAWTQGEKISDMVAHICSASCAHKALSIWLDSMQAKSHSVTEESK